MYQFTVKAKTAELGMIGGNRKYKSVETARDRVKLAYKRYTVLAWAIMENGKVVEQSGRM